MTDFSEIYTSWIQQDMWKKLVISTEYLFINFQA